MERIVLGRIGHYFDAGNGGCSTAIVVHVFEDGDLVNLTAFNQGGTPYSRTLVPLEVAPKIEDTSNSFHLTRDCPWVR